MTAANQVRPREPDPRFHASDNWAIAWRREHRRFVEELVRYAAEHPEDAEWVDKKRDQYG